MNRFSGFSVHALALILGIAVLSACRTGEKTDGPQPPDRGPAIATNAPTEIPESITTPDSVKTRLGTLEFFDGYPKPATVKAVYDHLDFMRGVRAFPDTIPIASLYAIREGLRETGCVNGTVGIRFGPEPPEGKESNWIQTVPGKGWSAILRLYGPLEPWFDQSWRPGEIEPLD